MSGAIWLSSYPKSGNTWMRLLLDNALSASDAPADINAMSLPSRSLLKRAEIEALTLIDTTLLDPAETDRLRSVIGPAVMREARDLGQDLFVKLHDAYRRLADGTPVLGRDAARAALYLLRDPRDVAVSLSHHNGKPIATTIETLVSAQSRMGGRRGGGDVQLAQTLLDWSGHVRSWTEQRDVPVKVIRYEDLRADTSGVLTATLDFLGIAAGPDAVNRAVAHTDLAELQQQERRSGFVERNLTSSAPFFRSGKIGAWREVLTEEQARTIEAAHGEVMRQFGYL